MILLESWGFCDGKDKAAYKARLRGLYGLWSSLPTKLAFFGRKPCLI